MAAGSSNRADPDSPYTGAGRGRGHGTNARADAPSSALSDRKGQWWGGNAPLDAPAGDRPSRRGPKSSHRSVCPAPGRIATRHAEQVSDRWACSHFSLGNPRDDGATDLPRLLRRLADEMERRRLDPLDILDVTVSQEMTEDGPWWSATVYWSPGGPTTDQ